MWRPLLVVLSLLCTQTACETTSRSIPVLGDFDVTHAVATRAFLLVDKNQMVGEVVRFDDLEGGRFFYSVRNPLHQELGLIDETGRAYRFRAHQPEPTWIWTGAVSEGVRRILGAREGSELREVQLADLIRPR